MQVMQDSLGGNAKTLMFVNISPADYNQDETVTALTYATRVKLITNTAEKQQVSGGGCEKKKAFLEEKSPESVLQDGIRFLLALLQCCMLKQSRSYGVRFYVSGCWSPYLAYATTRVKLAATRRKKSANGFL